MEAFLDKITVPERLWTPMSLSAPLAGPTETAPDQQPRKWPITGALLVLSAVLAAVGAFWLSSSFGWPDVLDAPGTEVLPKFALAETAARSAFYLMLISSLLLIPAAIYLGQLVGGPARPEVRAVTAFGVLGAFSQMLGWVRWPVTVPHLSDAYQAAPGETAKNAVAATYDVLNRYSGAALGEHIGWLFQGIWAIGIAVLLLRVSGVPRWFSVLGLVLAIIWWPTLTASGVLDAEWLAPVGSTVSAVWFLWLLALGALLILRPVGYRGGSPWRG
jgi:Domain of unknown function (DUF4386)